MVPPPHPWLGKQKLPRGKQIEKQKTKKTNKQQQKQTNTFLDAFHVFIVSKL